MQLSREALGTRAFKYTAGVAQEADGTFGLVVAAMGTSGQHRMPEPSPERRAFHGADIDDLGAQTVAFLREWQDARPDLRNQITCCTKVIENALASARKKLIAGPRHPPPGRPR